MAHHRRHPDLLSPGVGLVTGGEARRRGAGQLLQVFRTASCLGSPGSGIARSGASELSPVPVKQSSTWGMPLLGLRGRDLQGCTKGGHQREQGSGSKVDRAKGEGPAAEGGKSWDRRSSVPRGVKAGTGEEEGKGCKGPRRVHSTGGRCDSWQGKVEPRLGPAGNAMKETSRQKEGGSTVDGKGSCKGDTGNSRSMSTHGSEHCTGGMCSGVEESSQVEGAKQRTCHVAHLASERQVSPRHPLEVGAEGSQGGAPREEEVQVPAWRTLLAAEVPQGSSHSGPSSIPRDDGWRAGMARAGMEADRDGAVDTTGEEEDAHSLSHLHAASSAPGTGGQACTSEEGERVQPQCWGSMNMGMSMGVGRPSSPVPGTWRVQNRDGTGTAVGSRTACESPFFPQSASEAVSLPSPALPSPGPGKKEKIQATARPTSPLLWMRSRSTPRSEQLVHSGAVEHCASPPPWHCGEAKGERPKGKASGGGSRDCTAEVHGKGHGEVLGGKEVFRGKDKDEAKGEEEGLEDKGKGKAKGEREKDGRKSKVKEEGEKDEARENLEQREKDKRKMKVAAEGEKDKGKTKVKEVEAKDKRKVNAEQEGAKDKRKVEVEEEDRRGKGRAKEGGNGKNKDREKEKEMVKEKQDRNKEKVSKWGLFTTGSKGAQGPEKGRRLTLDKKWASDRKGAFDKSPSVSKNADPHSAPHVGEGGAGAGGRERQARAGAVQVRSASGRELVGAMAGAGAGAGAGPDVTAEAVLEECAREKVEKLGSEGVEEQAQAAAALRLMAKLGPRQCQAIASAGGVVPLVMLLRAGNEAAQEGVVLTLLNMALDERVKLELRKQPDLLPGLLHVLTEGVPAARPHAAATLCCLSTMVGMREAIVAQGGLRGLMNLLREGDAAAKRDACNCLLSLCISRETRLPVAQSGVVGILVRILDEGVLGVDIDEQAAGVFAAMARIPEGREELRREGAIGVLAELFECGASDACKEYAVTALVGLAVNDPASLEEIDGLGISTSLDVLSRTGTPSAQGKAAGLMELLNKERSS